MTTKEIKSEIQKKLDNVPDSVLQTVLEFLKAAENQTHEKFDLMANLKQIMAEDKGLLERLAK